jgi:hypothetical protein
MTNLLNAIDCLTQAIEIDVDSDNYKIDDHEELLFGAIGAIDSLHDDDEDVYSDVMLYADQLTDSLIYMASESVLKALAGDLLDRLKFATKN